MPLLFLTDTALLPQHEYTAAQKCPSSSKNQVLQVHCTQAANQCVDHSASEATLIPDPVTFELRLCPG